MQHDLILNLILNGTAIVLLLVTAYYIIMSVIKHFKNSYEDEVLDINIDQLWQLRDNSSSSLLLDKLQASNDKIVHARHTELVQTLFIEGRVYVGGKYVSDVKYYLDKKTFLDKYIYIGTKNKHFKVLGDMILI